MFSILLVMVVPFTSSLPFSYYHNHAAYYHSPRLISYNRPYYQLPQFIKKPFTAFANSNSNSNFRSISGDFAQETRKQAEALKKTLKTLSQTSGPAAILNSVIEDVNNVCLNSVDEAIDAIETSTKLIEASAPELKQLIKIVEDFQKLTDKPTVLRESANILRLLEVLIPKLAPVNPKVCGATTAEAFGSLRALATLVDELSSSNSLVLRPQTRQQLKTSAKVISGVTVFLVQLQETFEKFDQFCTSDREYNIEAVTAIGDMVSSLADLFGVLGGIKDGNEIRKQGDFTKKVVENINKLGSLDLGTLECNKPGSFKVAASTLDDLATLVEDVGVEALCKQLDLGLNCVF